MLTDADAGIVVVFGKENVKRLKANNTVSPSIKDTILLCKPVLVLFNQGNSNKGCALMTELVASKSKVELKANANVGAPAFDMAESKFGLPTLITNGLEARSNALRFQDQSECATGVQGERQQRV